LKIIRRGQAANSSGNRRPDYGLAANKWLFLVIICGILAGLGIFRLSAQQGEKKELHIRLSQALQEKEALNSRIKEVQNTLEPLRREVHYLRESFRDVKKEEPSPALPEPGAGTSKNPARKDINPVKTKASNIEKSLANIKSYKKGIEGQNAALKEKIEELSLTLEQKEAEVSLTRNENLRFKEQLAKAGREQEDLRQKFSLNLNDAQALRKQLSSRVDLENQIGDLNNKLLLLRETNSALEKQIANYRQEKALLEQDLDKARQDTNKKVLENEALNRNIAGLKNDLSIKEDEVAGLTNDINGLRASKKKLELDLRGLSEWKDSSNTQSNQLNNRISDLNLSSESMKNTINQLSGLLARKEAEIYNTKEEAASLKSELDNLAQERDTLASTLSGKEESVSSLSAKLTHVESQVNFLQTELASAKESQKDAAEQLVKFKLINSSLHQKFQNISKALEPIYMEAEPANSSGNRRPDYGLEAKESEQDKLKADELRKKVEVELDLEKQ